MRLFPCLVVLGSSALSACHSSDREPPESLDIFAALPDLPRYSYAVHRRSFGVGVESELCLSGDLGIARDIRSVSCPASECVVETRSSAFDRRTLFLVTPKVSDFHVHVEFVPQSADTASSVDRVLHAEDGTLVAVHPGAGPGVPFVEGMHVIWYIGTRTPGIAWNPTRAKVMVSPPFQMVDAPESGDGPDQDPFLRVEITAPELLERPAKGTVVVNDGATSTSFDVMAVPSRSITKLLIAPIPESAWLSRAKDPPFSPADRIRVSPYGVTYAWLAFETADGTRGIAGAGECLPGPSHSSFDLRPYNPAFNAFELDDRKTDARNQPYLELEGHATGTSRLLLAFGAHEGSADVFVEGP